MRQPAPEAGLSNLSDGTGQSFFDQFRNSEEGRFFSTPSRAVLEVEPPNSNPVFDQWSKTLNPNPKNSNPKTFNPEPKTRSPNPSTLHPNNSNPETLNPEPPNSNPETFNPKPQNSNPESFNPNLYILNPNPFGPGGLAPNL